MTDDNGYTHKNGLVYKNQYHIIFCPKYRRGVLVDGVDVRLKEILQDVADEKGVEIKSMEVMPDLWSLRIPFPAVSEEIEEVAFLILFNSRFIEESCLFAVFCPASRLLREEFPWLRSRLPSLWTRSYFLCSVGHISEDTITRYIQAQKRS